MSCWSFLRKHLSLSYWLRKLLSVLGRKSLIDLSSKDTSMVQASQLVLVPRCSPKVHFIRNFSWPSWICHLFKLCLPEFLWLDCLFILFLDLIIGFIPISRGSNLHVKNKSPYIKEWVVSSFSSTIIALILGRKRILRFSTLVLKA